MTRPPTNAQLCALTNAQIKVRLKALGLSVSGSKSVLIRNLETAYALKPDVEPSDDDEDPFSDKHSEDETEHHSPLTNAQLRALTSAQMAVRLKALGLSKSGNKPVRIRKLETAYGHRADVEPLDNESSVGRCRLKPGAYNRPLFGFT